MRCKLNDLAFINQSIRPQNIGLIVQCTELIGHMKQNDTFMWNGELWAAPIAGDFWVITSANSSVETQFGKTRQAFIADAWLTPIKPIPEEDEISSEETLSDLLEV